MVAKFFNRPDLEAIAAALYKPSALIEVGVFLVCLLAAWLAVRLLRGPQPRPGSVLFGERLIDGVLFPIFALAFSVAGSLAVALVVFLALILSLSSGATLNSPSRGP